jgi:hypothetical protein
MIYMKVTGTSRCVKGLRAGFSGFLSVLILFALFSTGMAQDTTGSSGGYSLQEALKVIELIDKIQLEQLEKPNDDARKVVVTESELNSYIAYRIDVEREEVMKELRLKIFEDDRLEGKIVVDLEEQNLPKILKPKMTFFMGGKLEVENGRVRLDLKDLFLGSQRIQPAVLDLVIFIGSKIQGTETFSIGDWWELPYGIKNIETERGKAIFYY